jgi:hypothetical protein
VQEDLHIIIFCLGTSSWQYKEQGNATLNIILNPLARSTTIFLTIVFMSFLVRSTSPVPNRPTGVTIIAILTVILGIMSVFAGISSVILGVFISSLPSDISDGSALIGSVFGVLFSALGVVILVIGSGYLVMSYGLLKGKGWAWIITIIISIIGIAINVISAITGGVSDISTINNIDGSSNNSLITGIIGSAVGIAINVIIIYYLYRPHVKLFFGKI